MSRYRTLYTEADNTFVPLFAVSNDIYDTDRTVGAKISPANPVPEQIPSQFSPARFAVENRKIRNLAQDQYQIKSRGYRSLRWYGDGPY
jgi:hypothetical protein